MTVQDFYNKIQDARCRIHDNRGVALLPMILVLFGLVMVVGVAIAGISVSENTISSTKDASDEALAIAESGIQDALMKLSRNMDFVSAGYNLSVSDGTATIIVPFGGFPKNITSSGTLNSKTRKIQLTVNADANGKITQSGWTEIAP
ncbi:hypothetical protein EPN15_01250 [Patescibacteria group bacterium]|nr:MAG: hypothetical protein EPN15_01250 [Patescibacteria group bacterium]